MAWHNSLQERLYTLIEADGRGSADGGGAGAVATVGLPV